MVEWAKATAPPPPRAHPRAIVLAMAVEAEIDGASGAQPTAAVVTLLFTVRESMRALPRDLGASLDAELPVARDALHAAHGSVRLQPERDGPYAVFEDTADRLLLRVVGDEMGLVARGESVIHSRPRALLRA